MKLKGIPLQGVPILIYTIIFTEDLIVTSLFFSVIVTIILIFSIKPFIFITCNAPCIASYAVLKQSSYPLIHVRPKVLSSIKPSFYNISIFDFIPNVFL